MSGQLGFGDGWISAKLDRNAQLERLLVEVLWSRFGKLLGRLRNDGAGRAAVDMDAALTAWLTFDRARYRSLHRNNSHAIRLAIAYNMNRTLKLA